MDQLLSTQETCNYLNISKSTLYRYKKQRLIPYIKKSFGLRFHAEDLEKWLLKDRKKELQNDQIIKNILTNPSQADIDKSKGGELVKTKLKTRRNYGYGAIYIRETKSGCPRFYADYRNRNGKRIQSLIRNATSWQEAHDWLKDAILKEHCRECGNEEKKQPVKLKEFTEIFLKNYSKVNKKSWKDDQYRLDKWNEHIGSLNLDEITPIEVEAFKSQLLQRNRKKTTINHYLKILCRLFNVAIDWGYIENNPAAKVKKYSEKNSQRDRVLSHEEEAQLFNSAADHLKKIMTIALNAGMRRGEILNLKWHQIDFKTREIKLKETKGDIPRTVYINSALYILFKQLKDKKQDDSYVFVNPKTRKPYKKLQTSFNGACRRAGIKGLIFHDLRRTFASRLKEANVDHYTVKKLLGHSSVKITERYIHVKTEKQKKAVELLCKIPAKSRKIHDDLLHIRYTEKDDKSIVLGTSLFSVN